MALERGMGEAGLGGAPPSSSGAGGALPGSAPPGAKRPLGSSAFWSAIYGVGMVLIFTGERIVGTGKGRIIGSAAGLLCLLGALVARGVRGSRSTPDRALVERSLMSMYALGLLGVALYAFQSDLPTLRGGKPLDASWPRLATVLGALWPAVWAAAVFAIVAIELAYAPMYRAARIEQRRIRAAQLSGLGLAFALVFAMALGYVTSERDKKVDLAYFRTTRPGESTRKIVRALDQPLKVALFFPKANEVREEVENYLGDLAKESSQLKIERYDYDIDPVKAKEYGVAANGVLVFARGGRKEQLGLQLQLESARGALRNLDREVQQRLLMVSRPGRVTYFTQGHGERTADPMGEADRRPGIRELRNALADQGHDVRDLGPVEGLSVDVPKDATLVMVLGPTKPFSADELASLQRYLTGGGRLYMAIDPDSNVDFHELLGPLGMKLEMKTLANDQAYGRRTHQDSDRVNLFTGLYSSHPSVSTLSRMSMRAPVLLVGAGAIEAPGAREKNADKDVIYDFAVHSHPATFSDDNGNFRQDPNESRRTFELAAAISKKKDKTEQRLFVVGDSDFLTDPVVSFYGNPMLVLDPVRWLMGEESFAGQVSTEADVPISHTRKQDVVWFYTSIFVAPLAVVALGVVVTRRRRRGSPRRHGATPAAAGAGAPPTTAIGDDTHDKGAQS